MPVRARWWHQGGNAVDQVQWRERDLVCLGTTLVTGEFAVLLGTAVHQRITVLAQARTSKRWVRAVKQQTLRCGTVVRLNTHTRID